MKRHYTITDFELVIRKECSQVKISGYQHDDLVNESMIHVHKILDKVNYEIEEESAYAYVKVIVKRFLINLYHKVAQKNKAQIFYFNNFKEKFEDFHIAPILEKSKYFLDNLLINGKLSLSAKTLLNSLYDESFLADFNKAKVSLGRFLHDKFGWSRQVISLTYASIRKCCSFIE